MTNLPAFAYSNGTGLALYIAPPDHDTMLGLIAQIAIQQRVRVVVGGNHYRAFRLARIIRHQTVKLHDVLERIEVARPFTCYQVVALFERLTAVAQPLVVLDLLDTFADENITTNESVRLIRMIARHLHRLRCNIPVIVSATYPPQPNRAGLMAHLIEIADVMIAQEHTPKPVALPLFRELL